MRGEAAQSTHDSRILGNRAVRLDEVGKRILHLAKGRDRLHESAQGHLAAEVARRRHDERHDDRELRVTVDVEVQDLRLTHEFTEVADDAREALKKTAHLLRFTAVEGDALAVFAHAHHAEAEVRFEALLLEVQPDELPADAVCADRAQDGVDEREPQHVAVDVELPAADRNGQNTRQIPQDDGKRRERRQLLQEPHGERERQLDELPDVL